MANKTGNQPSRGNRTGRVFPIRLSDCERQTLEGMHSTSNGPRSLGRWLVWMVTGITHSSDARASPQAGRLASRVGNTTRSGNTRLRVLDLCGGTGAWSEPYRKAGYDVELVTLPAADVRSYVPSGEVHGVLAAPPCTEFSVAKCGGRDFSKGLESVVACLRIIALCRPVWWALENPGRSLVARWLGPAVETWEPYEFGDPWTKRTALWGNYTIPKRGPFVSPGGSAMARSSANARAQTPPGFARAFFEANP
jgi:hypothetical protein